MCNFWYNTFWVVYIVISSTPVDEKRKKILWEKKICEYLRYLESWKYGDWNQDEHEILQRKWFLDDYRNLGNFSNFGYNFEKTYIYLSSERNYREGRACRGTTIILQNVKKGKQFLLEKSW